MTENIDPNVVELAKRIQKEQEAKIAKMKGVIRAKYPQADADSLRWEPSARKFAVTINCAECGNARDPVYTSDLFQVTLCTECAAKAKQGKRAAKKALLDKAMALIQAGQVK